MRTEPWACLLGSPAPAQPKVLAAPTSPPAAPVRSEPPHRVEVPPPRGPRAPRAGVALHPPRPGDARRLPWCLRRLWRRRSAAACAEAGAGPPRPCSGPDGGARWPGARAAGPPPKSPPVPLALMLVVQLPDGPLAPALRDGLRAVIDATFKHPKASLGLLVYEHCAPTRRAAADCQPMRSFWRSARLEPHPARRCDFILRRAGRRREAARAHPIAEQPDGAGHRPCGSDDLATRSPVVVSFGSPSSGSRWCSGSLFTYRAADAAKYLPKLVGQGGGRLLSAAALDELRARRASTCSQCAGRR